jgi:hypothetical protein
MLEKTCKKEWKDKKDTYFKTVGDANKQIYEFLTILK